MQHPLHLVTFDEEFSERKEIHKHPAFLVGKSMKHFKFFLCSCSDKKEHWKIPLKMFEIKCNERLFQKREKVAEYWTSVFKSQNTGGTLSKLFQIGDNFERQNESVLFFCFGVVCSERENSAPWEKKMSSKQIYGVSIVKFQKKRFKNTCFFFHSKDS